MSLIIECQGGPCHCLPAGGLGKALIATYIQIFIQTQMMKWNFFLKNMFFPCRTPAVNMIQVKTSQCTLFTLYPSLKISGHHSFDTSSADSSEKSTSKETRIHKQKIKQKKKESRSQLVTIVSINGEVTTFRTVCKKLPEKQVKISRSKTLPSSLYKNSLKVTVNGAGCFDFKEEF